MSSQWWDASGKADVALPKVLAIFIPLLIVLWFVYSVKKQDKAKPPLPPGPRGLPLVGSLPFLGSELHRAFKDLADVYGPIFMVRLGAKRCVVLSSPSLVKEVVRDHDINFANRDATIAALTLTYGGLDIAFSNYDREWRKLRKVFVSEMLSNASLDTSYSLRRQQVRKTVRRTYGQASRAVDVGTLAFSSLTSSLLSMIWGHSLKAGNHDSFDAEFRALAREQVDLLGAPNISDFFPPLARFVLQGVNRRAKKLCLKVSEVLDSVIRQHKDGENKREKDFLGYLLQLTKHDDPATSLTLLQVKAILMDIIIGGTDTTATTIEFAMAEMLQHPEIMKKAQDELAEIVGLNSTVEEAHLPKLKYLNAVVKESLRLHTPIPLLVPHCPSKPAIVGGYTIPEGSQIFIHAWAIHRDPQFWEAPLEFRPERFLEDPSAERLDFWGHDLKFIPFGSGRRICAGIPLAERTLMHLLASLLHAFSWSLPNGTTEVVFTDRFGIVTNLSKPLFAVPSPRLSNLELYSCEE